MATIQDCLDAEKRVFGETPISRRLNIMNYELGLATRSIVYSDSTASDKEKRSHIANSLLELSDLTLQIQMLRLQLLQENTDLDSQMREGLLLDMGIIRQIDAMKEHEEARAKGLGRQIG